MTKEIKKFIEENIETIENNRWFLLFMDWYVKTPIFYRTMQEWDELINILKHVDKNILETTEEQRKSVIITVTRETINHIKNYRSQRGGRNRISMRYLLADLNSSLGLSRNDLEECIRYAAHEEGLSFDINNNDFFF